MIIHSRRLELRRSSIYWERIPIKSTGGAVGTDWALRSNGYIQTSDQIPLATNYKFEIEAYGDLAQQIGPIMELRVDQKFVATFQVDSQLAKIYSIVLPVSTGSHSIQLAFTNDYYQKPVDRNLYITLY